MSADDKEQPGAARVRQVEDENLRVANDTMPGSRAELPKGVLRDGPVAQQGDEHRDQPPGPDGKPLVTPPP